MRILRIRRGFTTNSSGANEYIPSDSGTLPGTRDGGRSDSGGVHDAASPKVADSGVGSEAGPATVLTSVEPWGNAEPPANASTNTTTLGALFLVVAGAFVAGPVVRMILRKKGKSKQASSSDDAI